ncbi:hypothetical protein lbkm_4085 [Lachnospiraceae bacterium KM106-2]|nr:hypothetical protein lbkm_4085 [Lachnospiraceae bacterium KM106-2]
MSYFFDMVKEFVLRELKKEDGKILEDTELCFACGLYLRFMELNKEKPAVKKVVEGLVKNKDLRLLQASVIDIRSSNENELIDKLRNMIEDYSPEGKELDYVMEDVIRKSRGLDLFDKEIKKKGKKESKSSSLVCKTYKLPKEVVDSFAEACKKDGVRMGPQLTMLMEAYIQSCDN